MGGGHVYRGSLRGKFPARGKRDEISLLYLVHMGLHMRDINEKEEEMEKRE
jgi:hypothetical protein